MAWASGTITSATPVSALIAAVEAVFGATGVENWSFVEEIPAGTGTGQSGSASYKVRVWKCAMSGTSGNGEADFYVGVQVPVTEIATSTFYMRVFEDYEGGTEKRFKRPLTNGTTTPTGAGYWYGDTYARFASVTGGYDFNTSGLNSTGFSYYIKLTNRMLVICTVVGATHSVVLTSLLDSFLPAGLSDVALYGYGFGYSGLSHCFSRLPGVVTSQSFAASGRPWSANVTTGTASTNNSANAQDFWQSGGVHVSRMAICRTVNFHTGGAWRGLLPDDLLFFATGGTVVTGDTMSIDGNTYTVLGIVNNWGAAPQTNVYMCTRAV